MAKRFFQTETTLPSKTQPASNLTHFQFIHIYSNRWISIKHKFKSEKNLDFLDPSNMLRSLRHIHPGHTLLAAFRHQKFGHVFVAHGEDHHGSGLPKDRWCHGDYPKLVMTKI